LKGGCWSYLFELAPTPSLSQGFKPANKNFIKKMTEPNGDSSAFFISF